MKAKLLKRIRKNLVKTGYADGYGLKVEGSLFLHGAYSRNNVSEDNLSDAIRSLIIYTARLNYKRKGSGVYS